MTRKRYQIAAIALDAKGKVLGSGGNNYSKSHPLMKHFAVKAGESEQKHFIHAELAAILDAGRKNVDTLIVQRYHSNGEQANAMPCKTCQEIIKAFGVRKVMYTHESGMKEWNLA